MKFEFTSRVLERKLVLNRNLLVMLSACLFFSGCASFGGRAWTAAEDENAKGSVRIVSVSAEMPGDWGSLEKEIGALLPLLFSDESYRAVPLSAEADYAASVAVREREYPSGWKTRRSLSCEVRIWAGGADASEPLPLAAGRSLIQGKKTLASSKTLAALLKKGVKRAVRSLPKAKNDSPDPGAE